ncbi:MAG: molybdopterin-dependent oxidoreductase [Myxococcales bacterium]|nr:molybdopterin-dependent oxidoreductase [Myxococcales bacterium]
MSARTKHLEATRRRVLVGVAGAGAQWLVGCTLRGFGESAGDDGDAPRAPGEGTSAPRGEPVCVDAVRGGTLLSVLPFVDEGDLPFDTPTGQGLDGRLYTDLARLEYGARTVDNDRFYIRTRYPDRLDPSKAWEIRVRGLVSAPATFDLDSVTRDARPMGAVLLECSGNSRGGHFGLLSAAEWGGVPLMPWLRDRVSFASGATRVLVSGFDDHSLPSARSVAGASWVFTFAQLEAAGAFLATTMNGAPLPRDHGAPVRLVVPGWYGCTNIKWVDEIALVGDDEPSTLHMREFASRTHQSGTPALARDFFAASIDQTAMPVRVEKWRLPDGVRYRVVGIMWGGDRPLDRLRLRVGGAAPEEVHVCPAPATNRTWTWWSHVIAPPPAGRAALTLEIPDGAVRTRRLDSRFYAREVTFDGA